MNKLNSVCSGSVASTLGLKHAHERLNQMVSSDDGSGPLKRIGRVASSANEVDAQNEQGGFRCVVG